MNTEYKIAGNSIFYNNNLDEDLTTTSLFKKIKIRLSKKQQDTTNSHIKKMDIGAPQIKSTTNKSLQRLVDIKINNNLCNFIDIQNSNNNDNEKNMVKNNQPMNTEEIVQNDIAQDSQRNKLLQDIRNFKTNKSLKKTKENNKENNTNTSLQSIIEKEIEKRRQYIDSEEDGDEYNYDQKDSFA